MEKYIYVFDYSNKDYNIADKIYNLFVIALLLPKKYMRRFLLSLTIIPLFNLSSHAGIIVLEGNYQGKNLYVQNPFAGSGVGFCTTEVLVNDVRSSDEIQSSAFEIDFTTFKLRLGDKVVVKIKHKDDCRPKVLNAEVLKPASTYELISFKADDNIIKWTVKGESGPLPFVVEQYRWNKWVKAGEVLGRGTTGQNDYMLKIKHHSGVNKYRLQQTDYTQIPKYSSVIQYRSFNPEITFYPAKVSKDIYFSEETMYEIYDSYGNLVKKGIDKQVDASSLKKGIYYLNFDNKTEKFIKK